MTCHFLKLFVVRNFPKAANQAKKKKKTLKEVLLCQIHTTPREKSTNTRNKNNVVRFDFKHLSLGEYPRKLVFTTISQSKGIQEIEEQGKGVHLPVMSHFKKVNST
jgi:hypothetical protein